MVRRALVLAVCLTLSIPSMAVAKNLDAELLSAATLGQFLRIQKLMAQGADVDTVDGDGRTPLMWAACGGHVEAVQVLMEQWADVEAQDEEGMTALMHAVSPCYGFLSVGTRTEYRPAALPGDPKKREEFERKQREKYEKRMMEYEEWRWRREALHASVVRVLLDNGAAVNSVDDNENTALMYAELKPSDPLAGWGWAIGDLLRSHGAKRTSHCIDMGFRTFHLDRPWSDAPCD